MFMSSSCPSSYSLFLMNLPTSLKSVSLVSNRCTCTSSKLPSWCLIQATTEPKLAFLVSLYSPLHCLSLKLLQITYVPHECQSTLALPDLFLKPVHEVPPGHLLPPQRLHISSITLMLIISLPASQTVTNNPPTVAWSLTINLSFISLPHPTTSLTASMTSFTSSTKVPSCEGRSHLRSAHPLLQVHPITNTTPSMVREVSAM